MAGRGRVRQARQGMVRRGAAGVAGTEGFG